MQNNASRILSSAWKIIPQFQCRSVTDTIRFYTEDLHFTLGGTDLDDEPHERASMCSVCVGDRAAANLYLFKKDGPFESSATMIAMGTRQLDEYYELLAAENKVQITMPIKDQPWGYRQFEIKDIDGNRLQFFRFLEGGNPGTDNGGDASLAK